MVNVEKYQWVAIGDTIKECEKNYRGLLSTNGIVGKNDNSLDTIEGKITAIAPVVIEGTTHYYICIDNQEAIFDVNMTDESLIDVIRYKEGDTIKLSYTEGDNINQVNEILNSYK